MAATSLKSSSLKPRVVAAGVPKRIPLVTKGLAGSKGMVFLLQVMCASSKSFSVRNVPIIFFVPVIISAVIACCQIPNPLNVKMPQESICTGRRRQPSNFLLLYWYACCSFILSISISTTCINPISFASFINCCPLSVLTIQKHLPSDSVKSGYPSLVFQLSPTATSESIPIPSGQILQRKPSVLPRIFPQLSL